MKSVFAAIGAALRAAFRLLGTVVSAPGRLIRAALGFAPEVDDMPPPAPLDLGDDDDKTDLTNDEFYGRAAGDVLEWCAESLIDDTPAPVPPGLPQDAIW